MHDFGIFPGFCGSHVAFPSDWIQQESQNFKDVRQLIVDLFEFNVDFVETLDDRREVDVEHWRSRGDRRKSRRWNIDWTGSWWLSRGL